MAKKQFFIESELVFAEKSKDPRFQDFTGQKFSRLIVLGFAEKSQSGESKWYCRCNCGNITKVYSMCLKNGSTTSCGCFCIERTKKEKTKHGNKTKGNATPTYMSWQSMRGRCQNPKDSCFSDYGGRNIQVCERWQSFENFLADMGERPKGMTLDRKENNKGYFKENCRWATTIEQANNKRSNHLLTYNEKTQNVTQWAEETGIKQSVLYARINSLGWTVERALTENKKNQ